MKIELPELPISEHFCTEYRYLKELAINGAKKIYGEELPATVNFRLSVEFGIIKATKTARYYLILHDALKAVREMGILIGPGRGAAAGSLVAYCLGITMVDPLKHGLLFEKFHNLHKMPDFDFDVSSFGYDCMFQYLTEKYGTDRVNKIAIVDCNFPNYHHKVAATHRCGIAICQEPIANIVPLVLCSDEKKELIQCPSIDDLKGKGIEKLDFIELKSLSIIQSLILEIEKAGIGIIDLGSIPLNDEQTLRLFKDGEIDGLISDSDSLRGYYQNFSPDSFKELCLLTAFYRPGPDRISAIIRKKKYSEPYSEIEEEFASYFSDTYGLPCYQEQVMMVLQKVSFFPPEESYYAMLALCQKDLDKINVFRALFVSRGIENGFSEEYLLKLWNYMLHESEYLFCKSHNVSHCLIGYWIAYFKANYPDIYARVLIQYY